MTQFKLKIPALRVHGKLLEQASAEGDPVHTLRLDAILPPKGSPLPAGSDLLWIRFGFAFRGTEKPLIPSFIIDDVGNEEHRLRFIEWVYNDGDHYPRSEVFGYELDENDQWIRTQCFIRELELSLRFYTWVVDDLKAAPGAGVRLDRFGVPTEGAAQAERIKRPGDWLLPMRRSQATAWAIPVRSDR